MKEIEWAIEALAMLDVGVNIYCFFYVIKTFNTRHCLNYIMCIDSMMSAISSLVIIIFYAVGLKNSWTCSTVTIAILMVPTLMVVYHFIKAYIRYKRVWTSMNNQTWKTEKELIHCTTKALSLAIIILLIMIITDVSFEMKWIGIFNNCMKVTNGCVHSDQGTPEQRHMLQEMPMRSSILNFGLILVFSVTIPVGVQTKEPLAIATIGILAMLLIKSPVSFFWTVRVNETNARIDKDKDREQRRQLEVEEALKKRNERRKLSSMVQIQPLQLQDLEENPDEEPGVA